MYSRIFCVAVTITVLMTGSGFAQALQPKMSRATIEKQSVTFDAALAIARLAIAESKKKGVDLAVAVVDQAGVPLVVLRADHGTEQFITGATRKAWTAVNFKASTRDVLKSIKNDEGDDAQLPHAHKALFLMGGVPLKVNQVVVGAVGVAGCVEGPDDDAIAVHAVQAFEAMLRKQN